MDINATLVWCLLFILLLLWLVIDDILFHREILTIVKHIIVDAADDSAS